MIIIETENNTLIKFEEIMAEFGFNLVIQTPDKKILVIKLSDTNMNKLKDYFKGKQL